MRINCTWHFNDANSLILNKYRNTQTNDGFYLQFVLKKTKKKPTQTWVVRGKNTNTRTNTNILFFCSFDRTEKRAAVWRNSQLWALFQCDAHHRPRCDSSTHPQTQQNKQDVHPAFCAQVWWARTTRKNLDFTSGWEWRNKTQPSVMTLKG